MGRKFLRYVGLVLLAMLFAFVPSANISAKGFDYKAPVEEPKTNMLFGRMTRLSLTKKVF